jgi:Lrp/AsnC family transcriptional regulator, leucine-responsive regulatory protein
MKDDIDRKIVDLLRTDGRMSLTDLSEHIGLSRVAIATRLDNLQKNEILKVAPLLNLEKLQYKTFLVQVQVDEKKKKSLVNFSKKCRKVLFCYEVTDPYNYHLTCITKDITLFRTFVTKVLSQFVRSYKIILASNPSDSSFAFIKEDKPCVYCKKYLGDAK